MATHLFSQLILNWYHNNGRKDLPWQKNKTLYVVWISEIMLQQTTVKYVIPYFKKFISSFPNIKSLNNAKLDDILYLWSGLGYYNRAKNIYKSANIITNQHNGIFPSKFSDIIQLPGIGRSTAGAILSLSLNFFYPILDGNVKRTLIRYYGIVGSLRDRATEKKLWSIIESITPIHNAGKFNQAMMDIGALVCIPIKPKCDLCPLKQRCIAHKLQKWENYPLKNIQKVKYTKITWFILIKFKNTFWIEKNTKHTIWNDLFCFPHVETKEKALIWLKKNNINPHEYEEITPFIHKFSHFFLHIYPIFIELSSFFKFNKDNKIGFWYDVKNPQHIGLPKPVQNIFENFKTRSFLKKRTLK